MPSTHLSLHYHIVFSTKHRQPHLHEQVRSRVHEYLGGILRTEGGIPHAIGGTADHVHVLAGLKATHCLADVMQRLKSVSSRWIHESLESTEFTWQEGYGAFTVGAPHLEQVRSYVLNQETHHRAVSYEEEYVEMLKRGLVNFDERHLW